MQLLVIGSGSVGWSGGTACACFLISTDNFRLLLDIGPGAILSTFTHDTWGVDIRDVDAILFSHYEHLDHVGDFPSLLFSMNNLSGEVKFHPRTKNLCVFGPVGIEKFIENLLITFPYCRPKAMKLNVVGLRPATTVEVFSRIFVHVEEARHRVPALCSRIERSGKTIAYSGDTSMCHGLETVLRNADIAIVECSYPGSAGTRESHMTAPEVGRVAERAAVKRLLLTHRFPFATDKQLMAEVRREFSGLVELATPGQTISV